MAPKETLPFDQLVPRRLAVSTLRAEVVGGPDEGATFTSESPILSIGTAEGNELRLSDRTVSGYHLEFELRGELIQITDHDSTNGTHVGSARVQRAAVPPGAVVRLGGTTVRIELGDAAELELAEGDATSPLIGSSESMQTLRARVARAAAGGTSVLVVGESGTGKELVARALHNGSTRKEGPFVVVDCGAIAPELIGSELFGHEKGAFTGAERSRKGAFERADGGTLFLDEIGELPAKLQPALLGALERGRIRTVGGDEERSVDVRVVAATHRDLRSEVNAGQFRLDLYYRIAVVTLRVPPLRERRSDLRELVDVFRRTLPAHSPDAFGPEFLSAMADHRWPGNVRELRNLVSAMVAMGEGPETLVDETEPSGDAIEGVLELANYAEAREAVLRAFERRYLGHHLKAQGGNVSATARAVQMDRSHLSQLLKRLGLR